MRPFYLFALKPIIIFVCWTIFTFCAYGQNSLVGDGFGGRLWYKPYNYSVGSYSGYSICDSNRQLYAWGANNYGQLGNTTINGSSVPVKVKNMDQIKYYSCGYLMGVIRQDRSAWVWGYDFKSITFVLDDVLFFDAGAHVCSFIKYDGTVWSVGKNEFGSFGDDNVDVLPAYTAVKMKGVSNAVRLANSELNNYILLRNGTVMTVGTNTYAGLGDGSPKGSRKLRAVQIPGLANIVDIKATAYNGIALDSAGDVYTWGDGRYGCIGDGQFKDALTPKKVSSLNNIVAISGCNDGGFFLALDINHNCYGWGRNFSGGIGDGTQKDNPQPTLVAKDVVDILAGETFAYVVKKDGSLYFAGTNELFPPNSKVAMDLNIDTSLIFRKMNPAITPMNLCSPFPIFQGEFTSKTISICQGDSFRIKSTYYKNAGIYKDTLKSYYHFDSIVTYNIKLKSISYSKQAISICEGNSFTVGKYKYTKSGSYKDTLINYVGCDSIVTTDLNVIPLSRFNQNIIICSGEKYKVGKNEHTVSGLYSDTLTAHSGCDSIITTQLTVNPSPHADFSIKDNFASIKDSINLKNLSTGSDHYHWYFSNNTSDTSSNINARFIYKTPGTYFIKLIAINSITGCSDTVYKEINIIYNSDIYVPFVFTPNSDGTNDYFYPFSSDYDKIKMKIFNRWGELLFESNQTPTGWDGKYKDEFCPQGVYMYIIELADTINHRTKTVSGTLTLLR